MGQVARRRQDGSGPAQQGSLPPGMVPNEKGRHCGRPVNLFIHIPLSYFQLAGLLFFKELVEGHQLIVHTIGRKFDNAVGHGLQEGMVM